MDPLYRLIDEEVTRLTGIDDLRAGDAYDQHNKAWRLLFERLEKSSKLPTHVRGYIRNAYSKRVVDTLTRVSKYGRLVHICKQKKVPTVVEEVQVVQQSQSKQIQTYSRPYLKSESRNILELIKFRFPDKLPQAIHYTKHGSVITDNLNEKWFILTDSQLNTLPPAVVHLLSVDGIEYACTTLSHLQSWLHKPRPIDGHVYVVGFSTGVVKVGRVMPHRLEARLTEHKHDAAKFSVVISDTWHCITNAPKLVEFTLKKQLSTRVAPIAGTEYFMLPFHEVKSLASTIVAQTHQCDPVPDITSVKSILVELQGLISSRVAGSLNDQEYVWKSK